MEPLARVHRIVISAGAGLCLLAAAYALARAWASAQPAWWGMGLGALAVAATLVVYLRWYGRRVRAGER